MSPHSRLDDGLLDMVWLDRMPSPLQCARAIAHAYDGRILEQPIFHWQRVRSVELSHADGRGAPPPVLMADGEPVGRFPAKVAVERRSLRDAIAPMPSHQCDAHKRNPMEATVRMPLRPPLAA